MFLHTSVPRGDFVDTIVLYYSYEFLTIDPSIPFTTGPLKDQVTSARLNGKPAKVSI